MYAMGIIRKTSRGTIRYKASDLVEKPESFDDELPQLVRYEKYCEVHPHMSQTTRSAWTRIALRYVRVYLAEGLNKNEIINKIGLTSAQYDKMEQELLEVEGGRYASMGAAHRYYLYILRQELSLRYLDLFIKENYNDKSMIGAVKAKSGIMNDIIQTGQNLGVVDKRAKELRVLGDINLAVLPTEELELMYKERLQFFGEVVGTESKKLTGPHAKIVEQALASIEEEAMSDDVIQDAEFTEGVHDG